MLRRPSSSASIILLAAALLGGCGDDDSDPQDTNGQGGASGTASASSTAASGGAAPDYTTPPGFCAADQARSETCLEEPNDEAECVSEWSCLEPAFDASALHAVWQCIAERPCAGKSDDDCFDEVADQVTAPENFAAFQTECQAELVDCAGPDAFSDDWCASPAKLLRFDVLEKMRECFAGLCTDTTTCLRHARGDCE